MLHPVDFCPSCLQASRWSALLAPLVLGCGLLGAAAAQALEISPPRLQSGLGQPLQVQVALRLSPGDKISKTLSDPCFKAELSVGERQLKPSEFMRAIDWQAAEGGISMRLQTQAPVTEPVVHLSLGCPRQQFSLMLDPSPAKAAPASSAVPAAPLTRLAHGHAALRLAPPSAGPQPARRATGPALRLDPGLPLPAAAASAAPALGLGDWYAPLAGIRLLMAFDVGVPEGASAETTPGLEGPRPDRLKLAESQFVLLQQESEQLQAEMGRLSLALQTREQERLARREQQTWWGLAALLGLGALSAAGAWWWRARRGRPAGAASLHE